MMAQIYGGKGDSKPIPLRVENTKNRKKNPIRKELEGPETIFKSKKGL